MDYEAAAHYLGVTERQVRRLWDERKLDAVKVGKYVRFRRVDLDAYVERNLVTAKR